MLETLYRSLLKLYPRSFQEEYGDAMVEVFREDRGALHHFADLLVSVPREWISEQDPEEGALRLPAEFVSEVADRETRDNQWLSFTAMAAAMVLVSIIGWEFAGSFLVVSYICTYGLLMRGAKYLMRRYWGSFGVRLDGNTLTLYSRRGQYRVTRESARELVESPGRGLTISREGKRDVWIPAGLDGYEGLKDRLSDWRPVRVIPDSDGRILKI